MFNAQCSNRDSSGVPSRPACCAVPRDRGLGRGRPRAAGVHGHRDFPPEEFAARRAQVLAAIGDGVAILQGTTERPGEQPFRQNNQFFYLTGVVEPRAIAVIDGRAEDYDISPAVQRAARAEDVRTRPASRRRSGATLGVDAVLPATIRNAPAGSARRRHASSTRRSGRRC